MSTLALPLPPQDSTCTEPASQAPCITPTGICQAMLAPTALALPPRLLAAAPLAAFLMPETVPGGPQLDGAGDHGTHHDLGCRGGPAAVWLGHQGNCLNLCGHAGVQPPALWPPVPCESQGPAGPVAMSHRPQSSVWGCLQVHALHAGPDPGSEGPWRDPPCVFQHGRASRACDSDQQGRELSK